VILRSGFREKKPGPTKRTRTGRRVAMPRADSRPISEMACAVPPPSGRLLGRRVVHPWRDDLVLGRDRTEVAEDGLQQSALAAGGGGGAQRPDTSFVMAPSRCYRKYRDILVATGRIGRPAEDRSRFSSCGNAGELAGRGVGVPGIACVSGSRPNSISCGRSAAIPFHATGCGPGLSSSSRERPRRSGRPHPGTRI